MANEKDYIPEGTGENGEYQEGDDLKSSKKGYSWIVSKRYHK